MNLTCHQCQTKLTIPDEKIPRDKALTIKCPKCGQKVQVPVMKSVKPSVQKTPHPMRVSFEDRQNTLVCINGEDVRKKVVSTVQRMGLNVETALDAKNALNKMEYHVYHLVIIDAAFDQNTGMQGVVDTMNAMDMSLRRRICLVLINTRFNTNDNMAALHASVNSILHQDDIPHLEAFLSKAMAEHKNFYTVYNDSLKMAGRA